MPRRLRPKRLAAILRRDDMMQCSLRRCLQRLPAPYRTAALGLTARKYISSSFSIDAKSRPRPRDLLDDFFSCCPGLRLALGRRPSFDLSEEGESSVATGNSDSAATARYVL